MSVKYASLFVIALLLLASLSQAGREGPADPKVNGQVEGLEGVVEADSEEMDGRCWGDGQEECLTRRTLVAHADYIYTQEKHN